MFERHVMKLNVLTGGDMTYWSGITLRHIRERSHLHGDQAAEGNLDEDQLHAWLA